MSAIINTALWELRMAFAAEDNADYCAQRAARYNDDYWDAMEPTWRAVAQGHRDKAAQAYALAARNARVPGLNRGTMTISDDFDDPICFCEGA